MRTLDQMQHFSLRIEQLETRRVLASISVTNDLDNMNGDTSSIGGLFADDGGDGVSLREAILAANNTPGADEIDFDEAMVGNVIRTSSPLVITDDVSINGPGREQLTVEGATSTYGNLLHRLIEVNNGASAGFTGLTLTKGTVGIYGNNSTDIELLDVSILGSNTLAGDDGVLGDTVSIDRSTVSGHGGFGVGASGSLWLQDSTVSRNEYGLSVFGNGRIQQSTISANGLGLVTGGGGSTSIEQSTITGNGEGVVVRYSSLLVYGSIVAGNNSETFVGAGGLIGSGGYNLIGPDTGNYGGSDAFDQPGDQVGVDPRLGPLADNGGPTMTHVLLSDSPAVDAGDPNTNATDFDQRGTPYSRVVDGDGNQSARIDIGAFEVQTAPALGDFNGDGLFDCMDIDSLNEAIVTGDFQPVFDLDFNGFLDENDITEWLTVAGTNSSALTGGNPFLPADANLDGEVDGADFVIWEANKFTQTSAWCGGDFNADGIADGIDFVVWNTHKFTSSGAARRAMRPNRLDHRTGVIVAAIPWFPSNQSSRLGESTRLVSPFELGDQNEDAGELGVVEQRCATIYEPNSIPISAIRNCMSFQTSFFADGFRNK